jgi:hypothetical protein
MNNVCQTDFGKQIPPLLYVNKYMLHIRHLKCVIDITQTIVYVASVTWNTLLRKRRPLRLKMHIMYMYAIMDIILPLMVYWQFCHKLNLGHLWPCLSSQWMSFHMADYCWSWRCFTTLKSGELLFSLTNISKIVYK